MTGEFPYVDLDGVIIKRSWAGEERNSSVLVAIGVGTDGFRQILGVAEDEKEDLEAGGAVRWFGVPRRTVYYRPTKKVPVVQERFAQPTKQLIEEHPAFGYRSVAHRISFNKSAVQRVFQLMRWYVVRKPPVGFRPRVKAMSSVSAAPN